MTGAERALRSVRVDESGLPAHQPMRNWSLQRRRAQKRAFMMAYEYAQAENKDDALKKIAERWGYKKPGAALNMILRTYVGDFELEGSDRTKLEALRYCKREEVMRDSMARRAEIDNQIAEIRKRIRAGDKWIDVEEISEKGGKGSKTKIKRVGLKGHLRDLLAEREKSHVTEADALDLYISKPTQHVEVDDRKTLRLEANKEFAEMFNRMEDQEKKEVPVDAEVVDED
jgi:hypothetical protein